MSDLTGIKGRLFRASIWSLVGTMVNRSLGLLSSVLVARLVGLEGYGQVGILTSTIGMFSVLGGMGLGLTATKFVAESRDRNPELAGRIAGACLYIASISYTLIAVAVFVFSPSLAQNTYNNPSLTPALRLGALLVIFGGIDGVQTGILAGLEAFKALAAVNVVRGIAGLVTSILFGLLYGVPGVVLSWVVVSMIALLMNGFALRRVSRAAGVSVRVVNDLTFIKSYWFFSVPAFAVGILTLITNWYVNTLLVSQEAGYSQMGILNAINQWRALVILVPSILSTVSVSIQSNLLGHGRHAGFLKVVGYNFVLQTGTAALVSLVLISCSSRVLNGYGSSFSYGAPAFNVMAVAWIFMTASSVLWDAAVSANRVWTGLIFSIVGSVTLISLMSSLGSGGALGVALAYLLSYAVQTLCYVSFFASRYKVFIGSRAGA